jgi:hypothetical protein
MTQTKRFALLGATALLLVAGQPAAAQSLNWVHQLTGIIGPPDDIAIGFTGSWVNVFYNIGVGENTEVRGVRQFPANNPNNNTQYIPYPAPLTTVPSNVTVKLRAVGFQAWSPVSSQILARVGVLARTNDAQFPSRLFLIDAATPNPAPVAGVEAFAIRPNGELVTFDAEDLNAVGIVSPGMLVGAGATDLDVALVDFELVHPQNNIYEIRYRQTAYGTGVYLPPVVVASVPNLNPESVDFAMTDGGIPHVVLSNPSTQQVIARQFDSKANAWTTSILDQAPNAPPVETIVALTSGMPSSSYSPDYMVVAATWARRNPNNPNAAELDLRFAMKQGDGDWQVSTVCSLCVGNPQALDITLDPNGYSAIVYVSPTNQLMVAYDPPALGPPGDYNRDGSVDAADYVVWRKTDGSQDGFNIWRANFGQTAGGSAALPSAATLPAAVPESATFRLGSIALVSWLVFSCGRARGAGYATLMVVAAR